MSRISTRIGSIAPSATLAVDAKAKALQAQGIDVVGFGAGEPDFPTPAHIVEAAIAACSVARYHRYSPTPGLPELREAIAAKTVRDSGYDVSPSQVLVTNGGKQAVYEAFATLLDPGDEVLVPTPYWTTYPEAIRLAGGVPVEVETTSDQGYLVSVEQLAAARTPRTKVLLVVSPDNPTGAVHTPEELTAIGQWALETGLWVVTDEIYEHLTYGVESASIPVLVPELADRTIVLNGVAKTYAMTGWRVGWLIGPQDVVTAATNLQSHSTSNVSNVAQAAALAAVTGPLDAVEEMKVAFNRRRKLMLSLLSEAGQLVVPEPQGAFYCFPDASMYLGGRFPSTTDLATGLLEEAQVAVVPGEAFGAPGCLRLSYALGDEAITKGVTRMTDWLTRL